MDENDLLAIVERDDKAQERIETAMRECHPLQVPAPPSAEDYAALRILMGGERALRVVNVTGSDGRKKYRVEERPDTKNGGTYWFCPCPGWKFQMGKGRLCRHAEEASLL